VDILVDSLTASWRLVLESSLYLLLGFLVAGLLNAFLSPEIVAGRLDGGRFRSVLYASLIGVPLPL
jgi:uncharacterized membrane protein YraQ (UPF0718 family)